MKESRGGKLKGAEDVLFTGEYWAGETSVSLGLADGIGDLRSTLRARYGDKVLTPVIAPASGHAVRPARPQGAGAGALGALDGIAGAAGRPDFGAGNEGDLGQIRALMPGSSRGIWSRSEPIAGEAAIGDNTSRGRDQVNDKDRPMPALIAFAGVLGGLAVVRWAYKTAQRVNQELEEARLARMAESMQTSRFRRSAATPSLAPIARADPRSAFRIMRFSR